MKRKLSPNQKPRKRRKSKCPKIWDGWKEVFLCGTEIEHYDKVFSTEWDFTHFQDRLSDGSLQGSSRFVYVFGGTEPQLLKDGGEILYIPVLIAVVGDIPPPSKLGVMSVMKEKEEFVPFSDMKMTWTPFFTEKEKRYIDRSSRLVSKYFLHCNLRKASLKRVSKERKVEYTYLLPYFYRPSDLLREDDLDSTVTDFVKLDGRMINYTVDFKMENREKSQVLNEILQQYELDVKFRNDLKLAMKKSMDKCKANYDKTIKERKELYDSLSENQREKMESTKFVKFYPRNSEPLLDDYRVSFINRYFGKAAEVHPAVVDKTFSWGKK